MAKKRKGTYKEIAVDDVMPPIGRHRLEIDEEKIAELATSIEAWGLRQAIEVVERDGKYEIVFGERRWRAHIKLGRKMIQAHVVDLIKGEIVLVRATENMARENLTPLEEAAVFSELREEFSLTIDKIAKKVGLTVGRVKRRLDILRMPKEFQQAIHKGQVSHTVGEALWRCPDEGQQKYLLSLAIDHGITTKIARMWVEEYAKKKRSDPEVGSPGGDEYSPMEAKPIYQACDVCEGAVKLEDLGHLQVCKECNKKIRGALV